MRELCPDCGSRSGYSEYTDGSYCFSCNKVRKNKNYQDEIVHKNIEEKYKYYWEVVTRFSSQELLTQEEIDYLDKYELSIFGDVDASHNKVLNRLVIFYSEGDAITQVLARSLDKETKNKWMFISPTGKKELPWLYHGRKYSGSRRLVIVEDVLSAIKLNNLGLRENNPFDVLCLCGTNFQNDVDYKTILKYDVLIPFFDGDDAGRKALEKFIREFKTFKIVKPIRPKKDPKEYTYKELLQLLLSAIFIVLPT